MADVTEKFENNIWKNSNATTYSETDNRQGLRSYSGAWENLYLST